MRIPKEFKLFGQTIKVKYLDSLVQKDDNIGEAQHRFNTIVLQRNCSSYKLTKEQAEQVFFHELLHFCFEKLNEHDLAKNEALVDRLASLIHQAIQTAKY